MLARTIRYGSSVQLIEDVGELKKGLRGKVQAWVDTHLSLGYEVVFRDGSNRIIPPEALEDIIEGNLLHRIKRFLLENLSKEVRVGHLVRLGVSFYRERWNKKHGIWEGGTWLKEGDLGQVLEAPKGETVKGIYTIDFGPLLSEPIQIPTLIVERANLGHLIIFIVKYWAGYLGLTGSSRRVIKILM